ncbi:MULTISPECIES: YbdD/YjiX family protein [unclassified Microbacterium]|uniref:YbdD/YjiX family protein n=1 Tax=unclassified Microbacterium TaxID=2609290 RepID=UPI003868DDF8
MTIRTDAAPATLAQRAGALVVRALRGIRWYMTNLMGDSAYATYVAHQRRVHPDEEPITERQFWRQKMADQDRNPGARCC